MDTYATKTASAISAGLPGGLGVMSATKMPANTITSDLGRAVSIAEENKQTAERIRTRLLGATPESDSFMPEPQSGSIGEDIVRLVRALDRTRSVLETVEATLG